MVTIKDLREKDGLTQQQFADKLGVSRTQITNAENGTRLPSKKLLEAIKDVYKIDPKEFVASNQNVINGNVENSQVTQTINEHTHDIKELYKEISRLKDRVTDLERKI